MSSFSPPSSSTQGQLAAALAAAQGEFEVIGRSIKVDTGSFSYAYAPLEDVLAVVLPILSKHELALMQPLDFVDGRWAVRTVLLHTSGGREQGLWPLQVEGLSPQEQGKAITSARRYGLQSLLAIATANEDDDAQGVPAPAKPRPRAAVAKTEKGSSQLKADKEQLDRITELGDRLVSEQLLSWATIKERLPVDYGVQQIEQLKPEQADALIARLQARLDEAFDEKVY